MGSLTEDDVETWIRSIYAGGRYIVAMDVAVPAAAQAAELRDLGAETVLALGASRGTGTLTEGIEVHFLEFEAATTMQSIRVGEALLEAEPFALQAQVDAFDPDGGARVIRALYGSPNPVARRVTFGAREWPWVHLEDKTRIDAFWDEVGIERAPRRICPMESRALWAAHQQLDRGDGTVWVGDNKSGWHGGGEYLRWVRSEREAEEAIVELAPECDEVRVMPFLEGIPCSIHGIVMPDGTVALRPCEMLVFRKVGTQRFHYGGAATFWDPPAADREAMRAMVRRVGEHLRRTVAYRGVFTVDGIMTADGFLPTELNPRFGAAIGTVAKALPRLHLYLLHLAIVEGIPAPFGFEDLEALILDRADGHRSGRTAALVPKAVPLVEGLCLGQTETGIAEVPGAEAEVRVHIGTHPIGAYCHVGFEDAAPPVGPSLAPRCCAYLAYLDERFELGIGEIEPARPMRGRVSQG